MWNISRPRLTQGASIGAVFFKANIEFTLRQVMMKSLRLIDHVSGKRCN